jgi:hypothetical protein
MSDDSELGNWPETGGKLKGARRNDMQLATLGGVDNEFISVQLKNGQPCFFVSPVLSLFFLFKDSHLQFLCGGSSGRNRDCISLFNHKASCHCHHDSYNRRRVCIYPNNLNNILLADSSSCSSLLVSHAVRLYILGRLSSSEITPGCPTWHS